jgi:hypothetical protein
MEEVLLFSFWASLFLGFWVHYAYLTLTTHMRAKQSQAPERAEGKPLPEGKILMEVTAEEQRFLELLRVDELTLDPEAFNHRLLKTMLDVEKAKQLSPCRVEKLTGIPHQYHQKMHPTDSGAVEPHISLFTFLRWCGGLHVSVLRFLLLVIHRLSQQQRNTQQH